jgi:hypothetical protein
MNRIQVLRGKSNGAFECCFQFQHASLQVGHHDTEEAAAAAYAKCARDGVVPALRGADRPCQLKGVNCDKRQGRVVQLDPRTTTG